MQYQFWLYNPTATPAWSQLQGYSASPTCTWTPAAAGNYLLSVTARGRHRHGREYAALVYRHQQRPADRGVRHRLSRLAATGDTPITLTATATGGTNVQYQFWVYNPTATPAWSQLQGYSASATCTWTPAAAGQLPALRHRAGRRHRHDREYAVRVRDHRPADGGFRHRRHPPRRRTANTPITFTAVATGGTNVQYQFWLYNPNATPAWSQLQGYSTQATCPWTPTTPGSYLLSVTACDMSNGMAANTLLWYTVD